MSEVRWIKITVNMFDDEKIKLIQAMPEGDAILVIWIRLICLAGKRNDGGYVYFDAALPYTDEMLSTIFNKPVNIIRLAINTFVKFKMIQSDEKGMYLINFEKHQNLDGLERIREQTKQRVARHREKQKQLTESIQICNAESNENSNTDVALHNAIEEKEIRKEIKKESKSRDSVASPTDTLKRFKPPSLDEVKAYCEERRNNVDPQKWYNFYEAKGWMIGKNKMRDWKAAVRTWEKPKEKEAYVNGDRRDREHNGPSSREYNLNGFQQATGEETWGAGEK